MLKSEIAAVLASAGLRPQHQFGQNFMIDQNILQAIADAGEIQPTDIVLEIGPGVGNLTRQLAMRAAEGRVVAVDIDYKLLPAAQRHHAALMNITWLNFDALAGKHELAPELIAALRELHRERPGAAIKLVSNLPYNAASPLIANLLVLMWREQRVAREAGGGLPLMFERLVFTVQHEVARRMVSPPDSRDYGPLGILIQLLADATIVRKIPPGAFWPPPKIDSALVRVTPSAEKMRAVADAPVLQKLLAGLFSHRRQTLSNALKHYVGERWTAELKSELLEAGFPLSARPETLPPEKFPALAARLPA